MKAAILAVDHPLELDGAEIPKPLVQVAGACVIDHLLRALSAAGFDAVTCVLPERDGGVEQHCRDEWPGLALDVVRCAARNSLEQLFALAPKMDERFICTNVDALFSPLAIQQFVLAADTRPAGDAILAVSSFAGDRDPFWVELHGDGRVMGLGPRARESQLVVDDLFVLEPRVFEEMESARRMNIDCARRFLGRVYDAGYRVYGERVPKGITIEAPDDVPMAEECIQMEFEDA